MPIKRPIFRQRIPPAYENIQINFCKNPTCYNFGIPAIENIKGVPLPESDTGSRNRDNYTIVGGSNLRCHYCGQEPPMKSNKGVYEEFARMWAYLRPKPVKELFCPNEECHHNIIQLDVYSGKRHYYKDGTRTSGAQRYLCRECNRAFCINNNPASRQNKPYLNSLILRLLVNKMPLQRICEVAQVSMSTLYAKIDFIYEQCQAFAASHERRLPDLPIKRLQISVDCQDHMINWTDTGDKRNIIIHALGSADNRSGFVFGMHLNIDPLAQRRVIEEDARTSGDYESKLPFREYARYWLTPDFAEALATSKFNKSVRKKS